MEINHLLKRIEIVLIANKWQIQSRNEFYVCFVNSQLFDTPVTFDLPIKINARDFIKQLTHNINVLCQIDNKWQEEGLIKYTLDYLKIYGLHLSKTKKNWIIPEPASKYTQNEIPYIYVP